MSVHSPTGFPLPARTRDQMRRQRPETIQLMDLARHMGSNALAPVPQMVFLGDLTANKALLIEGLTGVKFPRNPRARPHHPTEIICRRQDPGRCSIRLRACFQAEDIWREQLEVFFMDDVDPTSRDFPSVFSQVDRSMELRRPDDHDDLSMPVVSEDVMTIQISAPDMPNLTLLDIPGIFEDALYPLAFQTQEHVMAQSILGKYINPEETLLLVALPCSLGPLTQRILDCVNGIDPEGRRTIVVLTKPSSGDEHPNGVNAFHELYRDHLKRLQYPFFYVGRDGDDDHLSASGQSIGPRIECFETRDNAGVPVPFLVQTEYGFSSLRNWLSHVLQFHSTDYYDSTVTRMMNVLEDRQRLEQIMSAEGLAYLEGVAARFRALVAENSNEVLSLYPSLSITPRLYELQHSFNQLFLARGHTLHFDDGFPRNQPLPINMPPPNVHVPDVIAAEWLQAALPNFALCVCRQPTGGVDLLTDLGRRFVESRRTNNGRVQCDIIMREALIDQTSRWRDLAMYHVTTAIIFMHRYIHSVLRESCPSDAARYRLMNGPMMPELQHRYTRAWEHAELLVEMEVEGTLLTVSPMLQGVYQTLADGRAARSSSTPRRPVMSPMSPPPRQRTLIEECLNPWLSMTEEDLRCCERMHDMLQAHYAIISARLLDNIFKQSIDLFLFRGPNSALRVFSTQWVKSLDARTIRYITEVKKPTGQTSEILEDEIAAMEASLALLAGYEPRSPRQ